MYIDKSNLKYFVFGVIIICSSRLIVFLRMFITLDIVLVISMCFFWFFNERDGVSPVFLYQFRNVEKSKKLVKKFLTQVINNALERRDTVLVRTATALMDAIQAPLGNISINKTVSVSYVYENPEVGNKSLKLQSKQKGSMNQTQIFFAWKTKFDALGGVEP